MSYWKDRQQQLNKQMEKDETKLKRRLSSFYDTEYRKLEKEIAAFYQQYGKDNIIEYRNLMELLSDVDRKLLLEKMDKFAEKYPEYEHLLPVRESIYKLDRLEGLQTSIRMQQLEIGAVNQQALEKHLQTQAARGANAAAETLGFGKNFYAINSDIVRTIVNKPWAEGKNFSQRIWKNTEKLANYLNTDVAQAFARGDSYERIMRQMSRRFGNVSRNDMYRLIYSEGTFVMAESTMQPFTEDFQKYRISIADSKACPICKGLAEKVFFIKDRQAGINFPALHAWCRCTFEIVVEDWDAWMDDYEKKHSNGQAEAVAKRLITPQSNGILKSGARITNLFSKAADDFAKMYYEEIRHFSTDVKKIARNLGKDENDIRRIKAYLFEDKSMYDPDSGEWRRFDPDCAIAQSWQRLMSGKDIKPHDRTLIEHELFEMEIKQKNPDISHDKAHEMATKKYNYRKEAEEYYGDLEKH